MPDEEGLFCVRALRDKENSLELVVKFVNLNYNVLVTASAKRQRMQS